MSAGKAPVPAKGKGQPADGGPPERAGARLKGDGVAARTAMGFFIAEMIAMAATAPLPNVWLRVLLVAVLSALGGTVFYYVGPVTRAARRLGDAVSGLPGLLGAGFRLVVALLKGLFGWVRSIPHPGLKPTLVAIAVTATLPFVWVFLANPPWADCPIPRELRVTASKEIAPALERLAGTFAQSSADWRGCQTVNLGVNAPGSAVDLRERLRNLWMSPEPPGPRPDLWISDSPAEIEYVRGSRAVKAGLPIPVATSPLVLAVPESLAGVVTRGNRTPGALTWSRLVAGGLSSRQVLRPHPRTSNVGLLAAMGMYEELRSDGRSEWESIEARVSADVGWAEDVYDLMCRSLRDSGGGRPMPAMIMSEQQLYEFGATSSAGAGTIWRPSDCGPGPAAGPRERLTPLYPKGGHALVYSCVPIEWPDQSSSPALREAIGKLCAELAAMLPKYGFRDARGVLPASLVPAGSLRHDATVATSWPARGIAETLDNANNPALGDHVLMLMDVSGSMQNKIDQGLTRQSAAATAARVLIASTRGRLSTEMWAFPGTGSPLYTSMSVPPGRNGGQAWLTDQLRRMEGNQPDASLRQVIRTGLDRLRDRAGRRVLVVLTDGGRPDGLDRDDLARGDGAEVILLTFGGQGCDRPGLRELRDGGALTCYRVDDEPPDRVLMRIDADLWRDPPA